MTINMVYGSLKPTPIESFEMQEALRLLIQAAGRLEREAVEWDAKFAKYKGPGEETVRTRQHEASERKWNRITEIWKAIKILQNVGE